MRKFELKENHATGTVDLWIEGKETLFGYGVITLVEGFQHADKNLSPEATADAIIDTGDMFYFFEDEEKITLRKMLLTKMYSHFA